MDQHNWIMAVPKQDASGGWTIVTAWYGDNRGHKGIDLGTTDGIEHGTPIPAPYAGKVVNKGYDGPTNSAGHWVWFLGDDGSHHKFFHTAEGPTVLVGAHVNQGDQVARVGSSGSGACHLHWELHGPDWASPQDFGPTVQWLMDNNRWVGVDPGDEEDEVTLEELQRELSNQDARTRAYIDQKFAEATEAAKAGSAESVAQVNQHTDDIVVQAHDVTRAFVQGQIDEVEAQITAATGEPDPGAPAVEDVEDEPKPAKKAAKKK